MEVRSFGRLRTRVGRNGTLTGVVSVLMFFPAAGLYGFYEYQPSAEKLQKFFNDNPTNPYYGGYLGLLSGVFLMWFAGSMYKTLCKQEGGEGRLALVAFEGGLASGIGVALA